MNVDSGSQQQQTQSGAPRNGQNGQGQNGQGQNGQGAQRDGGRQATADEPRQGGAQAERSDPPGDEAPKKKRRRPPAYVFVILAIVLIAGLIWGVRFLAYATTHQSTDDAMVQSDLVTITPKISERVQAVLVDTNQFVRRGQVLVRLDSTDERTKVAQAQAAIAAQVATARAAQANVDLTRAQQTAQNEQNAGSIVSARSSVSNASSQTRAAEQQAAVARSQVSTAQAQLSAAQAAVPGARESLRRAQADYARTAALVSTGDLSRSQLDAQRAALASAQSNYQQALDNVTAAETQITAAEQRVVSSIASANAAAAEIGAQQGQVTTAEGKLSESSTPYKVTTQQAQASASFAQVKSLQEQLRNAQDQLGYTVIRSPIDGYVGEKNIEIGATVSPGQSLMNIVPQTGVYITANYKETQIGKMRVGDDVDVHVDAYPGQNFHGKVVAISPAAQNEFSLVPAQNATGNFVKITQRVPVRVVVDNAPSTMPLRPGMSVETSVLISK